MQMQSHAAHGTPGAQGLGYCVSYAIFPKYCLSMLLEKALVCKGRLCAAGILSTGQHRSTTAVPLCRSSTAAAAGPFLQRQNSNKATKRYPNDILSGLKQKHYDMHDKNVWQICVHTISLDVLHSKNFTTGEHNVCVHAAQDCSGATHV